MKKQKKKTAESIVKEIKRHTRRKFNSEEKIRNVIEGLRGEKIRDRRKQIKRKTLVNRRKKYLKDKVPEENYFEM